MSATSNDPVLQAAIQWWVMLQSNADDRALAKACEQWRAADPRHQEVWEQLEMFLTTLRDIPPEFATTHLLAGRRSKADTISGRRRRVVKALLGVAGLGASVTFVSEYSPWQRLVADYSTQTGERRRVMVNADTQLDLASDTAVSVEKNPKGQLLVMLLRGQLGVAMHGGTGERTLRVSAADDLIKATDARFTVWKQSSGIQLAVYDGQISMRDDVYGLRTVMAGTSVYHAHGIWQEGAAVESDSAWMDGLLVANNDRLSTVIDALGRYLNGKLSVSDAVADLPVSGVFPLDDPRRALGMLEQTLPIQIVRWGPWWRIDALNA